MKILDNILIIIPAYDLKKIVCVAINSFTAQTHSVFEIIVVVCLRDYIGALLKKKCLILC